MKKGVILTIIGLIWVLCLAGCLSENEIDIPTPTPVITSTPTPTSPNPTFKTPTSTPTSIPTNSSEEMPKPKNDITIYSLNSKNFQKVAISVKVDASTITLFQLVEKITASLEDESFFVKAEDAHFEKTTAIVSFSKEGAPTVGSSEYESSILDCIAQSIIDNYDSCTAVIFRIEDKAYESANFTFGIDEAYLIK